MEHFIVYKLSHLDTPKFRISFFNSFTNLKVILISAHGAKNIDKKLVQVYEFYSKFVRNNAFYAVN